MKHANPAGRQQGFSLIEISLGLVLVVGIVVSIYQILQYNAWIEQAKTVAGQIKKVNEAVSTYAGNYSDVLSDKSIPPECETVYYGVVDAGADVNSVNVSSAPSSCSKNFGASPNTVRVANVMQPTLDELKQLNLLSTASSYEPLFITENRVVYKDASNRNAFLPPGYAVLIQRVCVNNPNAAVDSANYCASPSPGYYDLQTLVFSSQPYSDKAVKNGGVTNMLYTAYKAAGVDALLAADGISKTTDPNNGNADITRKYPLIPANSNGQTFLPNPLKVAGDVGLKNILAMRGGYSSSVRTSYLRPDGLTPMSGNLNMGNNDILDVNNITASGDIKTPNGTITASNFVATNQLTAREINTSSITSSGNIKGFNFVAEGSIRANDRIFTGKEDDPNCAVTSDQHGAGYGDINACRDMVAKGYVKGFAALQAGPSNDVGILLRNDGSIEGKTINVDTNKNVSNVNNLTQSGVLNNKAGIKSEGIIETTKDFITAATQQVQAGYFRFLNTVAEGAGCAADFANSLTLDSTNQDKLLRCNGTKWVSMLQKGEQGAPGTNGQQGIQGVQGVQGIQGVQGPEGAAKLGYTITAISVSFRFTEESGFGNTNLKCDEWTVPGFSKFKFTVSTIWGMTFKLECNNNIWQVVYARDSKAEPGNLDITVTSIKKNNGDGITVSDDVFDVTSKIANSEEAVKTIATQKPLYTTKINPEVLYFNRNLNWWSEPTGQGSQNLFQYVNLDPRFGVYEGSTVGWTALSFNGPVDVDSVSFVAPDRKDHPLSLSCTNWTKPVISGLWGVDMRFGIDQFESYCVGGYWVVKTTQYEDKPDELSTTNLKTRWLSYRINPKLQ